MKHVTLFRVVTVVALGVSIAARAEAAPDSEDVRFAIRPIGDELALSMPSANGARFSADAAIRLSTPSSGSGWFLGLEVSYVRTLICPQGFISGICDDELQAWAYSMWTTSQKHDGAVPFVRVGVAGGLLYPFVSAGFLGGGSTVTMGMVGTRAGLGVDFWVTPNVAIELMTDGTAGWAPAASQYQSTSLYANVDAQVGICFHL